MASGLRDRYEAEMETLRVPRMLWSEVFKVIQRANKYIDENAPWALAKDMDANRRAAGPRCCINLLETIRICGIAADALHAGELPRRSSTRSAPRRGCRTWESAARMGLPARETAAVTKGENLFPRIDAEKALAELEELEAAARKAALPAAGGGAPADGEGGLRHLLQVRLPGGEGQGLRGR